jgi:hypothetical protein
LPGVDVESTFDATVSRFFDIGNSVALDFVEEIDMGAEFSITGG